jgi:hypothetical protein
MTLHAISINRAPVLTLWAAVVAERLGHSPETALSLGKALAGLNAQSKGRRLGIYHKKEGAGRERPRHRTVALMGREIPVTGRGPTTRAVLKEEPVDAEAVEAYLEAKFGDALEEVRAEFRRLARKLPRERLHDEAYALYEAFRPGIPGGKRGWGARGRLDLDLIRELKP